MKNQILLAACRAFSMALFACLVSPALAQKADTPILKIGNDVSTFGEFSHMYGENAGTTLTPVSQAEYMDLFVVYKLKVAEARSRGIDTTVNYRNELKRYIDELAAPYLRDTTADDKAIRLLQERLTKEVKAEHILVQVRPDASPADTLAAYTRAVKARERVLAGEDFGKVAREVSEDPSAMNNGGDLGYFTAMQMVQPFEDYAFTTPVGSCSNVFRTQFGYHFLHVSDLRKTQGEVLVGHMMTFSQGNAPDNVKAAAKAKIDSLHAVLKSGADFADLARRESEDQQTAAQGGQLPWISPSKFRKEFEQAIVDLANPGDFTDPIRSPAGWHIFKLIDRRDSRPLEEIEQAYSMMKRRSPELRNSEVAAKAQQLRAEYGFAWVQAVRDSVVSIGLTAKTADERNARLKALPDIVARTKDGYSFSRQNLMDSFSKWLPGNLPSANIEAVADAMVIDYEKTRLADKYPDYRYTSKEYTEGLLVFDVTSKDVWSKEPDTLTIRSMYEANKPRYSKGGVFEGDIFFCRSQKDAAKVQKLVEKGKTDKARKIAFQTISGRQEQGGDYDDLIWPSGQPNKYVVLSGKTTNGKPLPLKKATSTIVTDYQQLMEAQLVETLKAKFKPVILKKIE